MKHVKRFFREDVGAELSEYAVAIALLVVVAVVIYSVLGQSLADENSGTGAKVKNVDRTFPFN